MASLLGSSVGVVFVVALAVGVIPGIVFVCWAPFNIYRIARNTRRMADALERIADAAGRGDAGGVDEVRALWTGTHGKP